MILPERPDWHDLAKCNSLGDDTFFPLSETPAVVENLGQKYCNLCPVRVDCLKNAIETRSRGVWAGTNSDTRIKLRKTRNRAKCPSCLQHQLVYATGSQICLCCGISWPAAA